LGNQQPSTLTGEGSQTKDEKFWRKYMDENKFMNRVIELVEHSRTQRDGVGTTLVEEFNLSGKHTATRLAERLLGISISKMLKLRFAYPDTWKELVPKLNLVDTKDMYTRIKELRAVGSTFQQAKDTLTKEFSVSEMELVRRVRSLCQMSLSEYFKPTESEIQEALIRSETVSDFWQLLGTDAATRPGFFDRELGVANFVQAKASCLNKIKIPRISPCTSDNEALVFSQVLGDGSYDSVRKVLRITHGIKQLEYLRWKVSMLKNAYPALYGIEKIKVHVHAQGHEYCTWYSGKLPEHVTNKIESFTHKEMVNALTPLGMLWLFLDDGCLFWKDTKSIGICQGTTKDVHQDLTEYLSTYNIHSISYDKTCQIAQQVEIIKFINTFVKPYIDIIPASMQYKANIMI
jgi:hypothetical protein